uniref:Uncharacterized protein n=1 Tax=Megaviridae environmental sample TaxID=1737588 RepID=A0A5J6VMD8_9VIRU|nr:MAG: hypothetical protein [Megaviridae environmental sample]
MSSNYNGLDRTLYDEEVYVTDNIQRNKPLGYVLNTGAYENCAECNELPTVTNHVDRVILENDLLGHNRRLSNDPKLKYQPRQQGNADNNIDLVSNLTPGKLNFLPPYVCERNLDSEDFLPNKLRKNVENLKNTTKYVEDKFLEKLQVDNNYMDELKKLSPDPESEQYNSYRQLGETSGVMCDAKKYLQQNN